ncbi:MAG: hypothetical protein AAF449_10025 [Myxococcota bacterium]
MGSLSAITAFALVAGAYDPTIDTQLIPPSGIALGVGVQRLQDEFGLQLEFIGPRLVDDRLTIRVAAGLGWFPDLRSLPEGATGQDFDTRALYGHTRFLLDGALPLALVPGRLYAAAGPSFLILPRRLSTTRVAPGLYGAVGVELFAGTAYRTSSFSFFFEIGATAHAAAADVAERTGPIEVTDLTVDRPIGTGLALSGGLRWYFWR